MRSGGADYAFWLCKRLAESGLAIHVLTSDIKNVTTDPKVQVYPVMRQWNWFEFPRLLRLAYRCRPDVVNIHFTGEVYHNQPMITILPGILKRIMPLVSVVTHIEYPMGVNLDGLAFPTRVMRKAIAPWIGTRDLDWGYGTLLRDSDRLVILSEPHRHMLSNHLSSVGQKCVLIPPPPNLRICGDEDDSARRRGRELSRVDQENFVLAYYGYLYPRKGIETLLTALHLVAQEQACPFGADRRQ